MSDSTTAGSRGIPRRELRLFQAQQILSENLNIPLRVLRGDCLERLEGEVKPEQWHLLGEFLEREGTEDPVALWDEAIPERLSTLLSPADGREFARISSALWATVTSAPHPFYEEIKLLLPRFQARVRLNLLRKVRVLRSADSAAQVITLDLPAGLRGMLIELGAAAPSTPQFGDILVVGPARLLSEDRTGGAGNRFVALEQQTRAVVQKLSNELARPLTIEDKTNLLVLSSAYLAADSHDLGSKARTAKRALDRVEGLERRHGAALDSLSSAAWSRLIHFLFFWQSGRTQPLLQQYVAAAKESSEGSGLWKRFQKQKTSVRFRVTAPLSLGGSAETGDLGAVCLVGKTKNGAAPSPEGLEFDLIASDEAPTKGELSFQLDDGDRLGEEALGQLTYFFHRSIEDAQANRAWQEYLSFDRLRHRLQHQRVDEVSERVRLFTERARELVNADVAAYFAFDSLHDQLELDGGYVAIAPWVERNDLQATRVWLKRVAEDPTKRKQSAIYRCLDSGCFQSKLLVDRESHPFAYGFADSVELLPLDEELWGLKSQDAIAVPVQFHDRILGVLYLMAGTRSRFRYYDRIRLLSFVRMFEGQLFEAALFSVLRQVNSDLGSALQEKLTQKQFCERLMQRVGRLLGVAGAVLWWRSPSERDSFEVLGLAGGKLAGRVRYGDLEKRDNFPTGKPVEGVLPVTAPVEERHLPFTREEAWPLAHTVPLLLPDLEQRNVLGVITLHDTAPIEVSEFLVDELQFLRDEIGQSITSYREHRHRIQTIRDLIGHDLSSALKHIDSTRRRLAPFESSLDEKGREGFRLRLGDLDRTVRRAQQLLDLLTRESLRWQLLKGEAADLFAPYKILSEALEKQISIHEAIKTAFHSKDLFDRQITFEVLGAYPPRIWLDEGALGQVLGNLVDNIVKYGESPQKVRISYEQDELEFFVYIESRGLPLRQQLREQPERVFRKGVRGVDDATQKSKPGSGHGLFLARGIARVWEGTLKLRYAHGEPWATYRFTLTFPRWLANAENPWRQR